MAGGGYILSNKALEKFAETLLHNATVCHPEGGAEDWEMGRCLEHSAIFVGINITKSNVLVATLFVDIDFRRLPRRASSKEIFSSWGRRTYAEECRSKLLVYNESILSRTTGKSRLLF